MSFVGKEKKGSLFHRKDSAASGGNVKRKDREVAISNTSAKPKEGMSSNSTSTKSSGGYVSKYLGKMFTHRQSKKLENFPGAKDESGKLHIDSDNIAIDEFVRGQDVDRNDMNNNSSPPSSMKVGRAARRSEKIGSSENIDAVSNNNTSPRMRPVSAPSNVSQQDADHAPAKAFSNDDQDAFYLSHKDESSSSTKQNLQSEKKLEFHEEKSNFYEESEGIIDEPFQTHVKDKRSTDSRTSSKNFNREKSSMRDKFAIDPDFLADEDYDQAFYAGPKSLQFTKINGHAGDGAPKSFSMAYQAGGFHLDRDKAPKSRTAQFFSSSRKSGLAFAKSPVLKIANQLETAKVANPAYIIYNDYGTNWALDVFTMQHNAARKMMVDLCRALYSIEPRLDQLTVQEVKLFFSSWRIFTKFMDASFDVEERKIFGWIETFMPLEGEVGKPSRSSARLECMREIDEITALESLFYGGHSTDCFKRLVDGYRNLQGSLLGYFNLIESEIPPVMSMFCTKDGKLDVDVQIRDYMLKTPVAGIYFPALVGWCEGTIHSENYLNLHFKGARKVLYNRWKKQYDAKFTKVVALLADPTI